MKSLVKVLFATLLLSACAGDGDPRTAAAEQTAPSVIEPEKYGADVAASTFKDFPAITGKEWAGRWTLDVKEDRYLIEAESFSFRATEMWSGEGTAFDITATPAPIGAFNCYTPEGERLTGREEASAEYEVIEMDDGFELKAVEDPCPLRAALLERSWELF